MAHAYTVIPTSAGARLVTILLASRQTADQRGTPALLIRPGAVDLTTPEHGAEEAEEYGKRDEPRWGHGEK